MYVTGYATQAEVEELERRGWEIEYAHEYNLIGEGEGYLFEPPEDERTRVIVVWVDSSVFEVMDGPDWDKG
jgi:hypothetical protein